MVLALEIVLPNGSVLISCFEVIDTACPTDPVVTGGWTTPILPHLSTCAPCLQMISAQLQIDCVTTTTTQWWECVRGHVPVPGVDAIYCDSSTTYVTPPGVSSANGSAQNFILLVNHIISTYTVTLPFALYFFVNPNASAAGTPCQNTNPNLYNGNGLHMKVTGIFGGSLNQYYILSGPLTTQATWSLLITTLNNININNSWSPNFLLSDDWNQVITKMQANAPNDTLILGAGYCLCIVSCSCIPCSSGPNCIYTNEPDCLLSANATPCCVTTTYRPATTTTTTSNLVGLKLCCDPYTEYEVIYNSSLYNLIDYSLSPFTRAFVMTITLPNGQDLTACVEMDMNIPPGSPQVQGGINYGSR